MSFDPHQLRAARQGERERMVRDQLMARDIRQPRVLAAMREVPRELFVDAHIAPHVYVDAALSIECQQTISQPYIVAKMTELLVVQPQHRVLEVGTGSGYQAAILSLLASHVVSVERHAALAATARERLARLGIANVDVYVGDGSLGWPHAAPFDRIIATAGSPRIPQPLIDQLKPDGVLILPVGPRDAEELVRVRPKAGGPPLIEHIMPVRFVRMMGQYGWQQS